MFSRVYVIKDSVESNAYDVYERFPEGCENLVFIGFSKDDYSKSHSTYYSPILMEAFIEIDKIIPYENYPHLERNEQIELYKKVVEILLKFDCIEKEIY